MTKTKPRDVDCRNLSLRGAVIYYERVRNGERDRFSCETADWAEAAAIRDSYEEKLRAREALGLVAALPSLADFAERYLEEDTGHLAPTTKGIARAHCARMGRSSATSAT